jgi:hypothetical protein
VAAVSATEKALVGVAVEVRGAGSGRLRLQVLADASSDSLGGFVAVSVADGATVHTDGWAGYAGLAAAGLDHRVHKQRLDHRVNGKHVAHPERQFVLPRAHRAISNLKTWLQGTHRNVSPEHLQVYLDEFVFRHNRRRTPLAAFQTLLGLGALREPTTYHQITHPAQTELTG